jgi:hypothetical protein
MAKHGMFKAVVKYGIMTLRIRFGQSVNAKQAIATTYFGWVKLNHVTDMAL